VTGSEVIRATQITYERAECSIHKKGCRKYCWPWAFRNKPVAKVEKAKAGLPAVLILRQRIGAMTKFL